jgi:hypothetical protein
MIIITPGMLLLICLIVAFYSAPQEERDDLVGGFLRMIGWLLARLVPPTVLFIIAAVSDWPGWPLAVPLATLGWWVYLAVRRSRRKAAERERLGF